MSIKIFFLDESLRALSAVVLLIIFLVYYFKMLYVLFIVLYAFPTVFTFMNGLMSKFVGFKLFGVIKYLWFRTLLTNKSGNTFVF